MTTTLLALTIWIPLSLAIFKGTPVRKQDLPPYLVNIATLDKTPRCQGVILHSRHVLTTAYCIRNLKTEQNIPYDQLPNILQVRAGFTDLTAEKALEPGETEHSVSEIRFINPTPGEHSKWLDNIALLTVNGTFPDDRIARIGVSNRSISEIYNAATVMGWGLTNKKKPSISQLLKVKGSVDREAVCCSMGLRPGIPHNLTVAFDPLSKVCMYYGEKRGPCLGDGGSPCIAPDGLVLGIQTRRLYVQGHTTNCGDRTSSAMCDRIDFRRQWIEEQMQAKLKTVVMGSGGPNSCVATAPLIFSFMFLFEVYILRFLYG